ncbi:hypothetical protein BH23GEM4_BH23GEM4_13970 [soil metagenome]
MKKTTSVGGSGAGAASVAGDRDDADEDVCAGGVAAVAQAASSAASALVPILRLNIRQTRRIIMCCYSATRTAVPLALTINIPPLCPVVIVS